MNPDDCCSQFGYCGNSDEYCNTCSQNHILLRALIQGYPFNDESYKNVVGGWTMMLISGAILFLRSAIKMTNISISVWLLFQAEMLKIPHFINSSRTWTWIWLFQSKNPLKICRSQSTTLGFVSSIAARTRQSHRNSPAIRMESAWLAAQGYARIGWHLQTRNIRFLTFQEHVI